MIYVIFKRVAAAFSFIITLTIQSTGQVNSAAGTEFWLGFMENANSAMTLELMISSEFNTSGFISMPQQGLSLPFTVNADSTTVVAIPGTWNAEIQGSEMITPKGILVQAQDSVSVFAASLMTFTSDATKILPLGALSNDYMVNACYGMVGFSNFYRSEFLIVATYDDTQIEIIPSVETMMGASAGIPFTINLDAGEAYQVQSMISYEDLSGTIVKGIDNGACKPFALFGGAMCAFVPNNCTACDHLFDQNHPVQSWGTSFNTVPFALLSGYTYKVMASEDDTEFSVDGNSPITLNKGEFIEVNYANSASCIESNKPICVTQFMQGVACSGGGDPSMLSLNAQGQELNHISFSTVVSAIIPTHWLTIVTETTNAGQVILDGSAIPVSDFNVFPTCADLSFAIHPLTPGSHTLDSQGGFNAYVYGSSNAESYAYSLGSSNLASMFTSDTIVCALDTVTLTAPGNYMDPVWTTLNDPSDTLATTGSITVPPDSTFIYIVSGVDSLLGCALQKRFHLETSSSLSSIGIVARDSVCQFEEIELSLDVVPDLNSNIIVWEPQQYIDDPNSISTIARVMESTWYYVTVSSPGGCISLQDSLFVHASNGDIWQLGVSSSDDAVCEGDSVQLASQAMQVEFSDLFNSGNLNSWEDVQGASLAQDCGYLSGDALYFNGANDRFAETPVINVLQGGTIQFSLKIATGASPCEAADVGEYVVLEYSTDNGFSWLNIDSYYETDYPDFTLISLTIPIAAQSAFTKFRWRQVAFSGANEDNWALENVVVASIHTTDLAFAWTPAGIMNDAFIADPMALPSISSSVVLTATDTLTQCVYQDSSLIEVGEPFTINISIDSILCADGSYQLSAQTSAGFGHIWTWAPNNGTLDFTTIPDPVATPNTSTTYYVTATSALECSAISSINLSPIVEPDLGPNINACEGDTIVLDPGPGFVTYLWNDQSTAPTLSITTGGAYSVTTADSLGCLGQSYLLAQFHPNPPIPVITSTDSITLLCFNGGTLQWFLNGVPIIGATNFSYTTTQPGVYQVERTDPITLCSSMSEPFYLGITSIQNHLGGGIEIVPNPFGETVVLQGIPDNAAIDLNIQTIEGKTVKRVGSNERIIDTSDLQPGVYSFHLNLNGSSFVQKMIKVEPR